MRYEFWLALRFLFARRREHFISLSAFLSIGSVALGVAALLVILAVMSGFDHDLKEKLVGINAHVIVDSPQGIADTETLMRRLRSLEHVVGVSPFITGQAILRLPDQAFGVIVRGLDPQREARVSRLAEYLVLGRLPERDEEVVIGSELAGYLRAAPGETLRLISPADGKVHELSISGIFRSGMYEYDATLIGVTLARAQALYQLEGVVTGIGVKLDRLERAPAMRGEIQEALGPAQTVRTWMDLNPALFGALRVEKMVIFVIAALIIVVAAMNIISTLTMIVMEKTRDIGILRALGATRGSIATLFLSQGCVVGLLGISLGLAGGFFLARHLNDIVRWAERTFGVALFSPEVYYLDHIPTRMSGQDAAWVVGVAFLLAISAAAYAAVRAARLVPLDALRYE